MIIQSLEQKTRLAMMTVLASVAGSVLICATTLLGCWSMIDKERQQIYILDGDIPFLAERAQLSSNFIMESKAHINLFHQYFFNLPPDDAYMNYTVGKALY
ncbi:MAG: conjugative transposon protein TraK, partial [Muribaculaceae bacterium]|nr:conjugative transposon protein TraK [Muribaculaceae bacterium]